ncbi:hypothetical protein ACIF8T_32010 [Streptomyces sp. NPDC085946]
MTSTLTTGRLLPPRATRTPMVALTTPAGADTLRPAHSALVEKTTGGD